MDNHAKEESKTSLADSNIEIDKNIQQQIAEKKMRKKWKTTENNKESEEQLIIKSGNQHFSNEQIDEKYVDLKESDAGIQKKIMGNKERKKWNTNDTNALEIFQEQSVNQNDQEKQLQAKETDQKKHIAINQSDQGKRLPVNQTDHEIQFVVNQSDQEKLTKRKMRKSWQESIKESYSKSLVADIKNNEKSNEIEQFTNEKIANNGTILDSTSSSSASSSSKKSSKSETIQKNATNEEMENDLISEKKVNQFATSAEEELLKNQQILMPIESKMEEAAKKGMPEDNGIGPHSNNVIDGQSSLQETIYGPDEVEELRQQLQNLGLDEHEISIIIKQNAEEQKARNHYEVTLIINIFYVPFLRSAMVYFLLNFK